MNYDKIIKILLLTIVFLVPLFILRTLYDVFSLDKMTLLRLLSLGILACLALKICHPPLRFGWHSPQLTTDNKFLQIYPEQNQRLSTNFYKYLFYKIKSNPLILPVLAYLIISTLATIFSVAPWISLLGFYKRYEGLSTLLIYIILFFTVIYFAKERKFQERMFCLIFLASILMSIYGLMQYFEIDPLRWKAQFELTKAFSTFGNPNFLGAYLAMTFPLGLYLFLKIKKKEKIDYSRLTRKERRERERQIRKGRGQREEKEGNLWILGIGLSLIYACLITTLNRGGILALFGGLTIFVFVVGWKIIKENRKRLVILGIVLILITVWQGPALWERFSDVIRIIRPKVTLIKEVKAQEKEAQIIEFLGSANERVWIWKRSFKIIQDHPWLGVGPDAMALVYWPYEKIGEPMTHRSLVDRAHNDFIDQAVTRGLLGLVAYLWIIGTIIWMGWKIARQRGSETARKRDSEEARQQEKMRKKFLSFQIPQLPSFQTSRLFLAAILAGITAYLIQNQLSFGVSGISSLFWIFMGMLVKEHQSTINNQQSTIKNQEIKKSYKLQVTGYTLLGLSLFIITFLAFWTIRLFIADIYYKQGQISQAKKEVDRSIEMYRTAAKLNPKESFYQEGVSLATYDKVKDVKDQEKIIWIKKTIEETEKAIRLNPANGFFYNTMGVCHSALVKNGIDQKENENKAIEYYRKAIFLTPKLTEAYNNLALVLMTQGKLDESYDELIKALRMEAGQYGTDASSYKLGQELLDQGKSEKALELFQEVVKWKPNDIDALRNLGVAYNKAGQNNKAIETFEKILKIDPKNEYAKKALKAISND